jgi:hypothetical protein
LIACASDEATPNEPGGAGGVSGNSSGAFAEGTA